jgi:hypothetical protein
MSINDTNNAFLEVLSSWGIKVENVTAVDIAIRAGKLPVVRVESLLMSPPEVHHKFTAFSLELDK